MYNSNVVIFNKAFLVLTGRRKNMKLTKPGNEFRTSWAQQTLKCKKCGAEMQVEAWELDLTEDRRFVKLRCLDCGALNLIHISNLRKNVRRELIYVTGPVETKS